MQERVVRFVDWLEIDDLKTAQSSGSHTFQSWDPLFVTTAYG